MSIKRWYKSKFVEGLKVLVSHEQASFKYFQALCLIHEFKTIIELGTAHCGLTLILHEALPKAKLYTYDKFGTTHKRQVMRSVKMLTLDDLAYVKEHGFNENVEFKVEDVIDRENEELVEILRDSPRPKLLYCDNGNKVKEVELYSKHLYRGDVLGIHDWGTEVFPADVAACLSHFSTHPFNALLHKENCTSRFFIRS